MDLSINPNTVVRAYRELEIRGVLETQQGTGTFISHQKVKRDEVERQRRLNQLVGEFVARAGAAGFTVQDLLEHLNDSSKRSRQEALMRNPLGDALHPIGTINWTGRDGDDAMKLDRGQ